MGHVLPHIALVVVVLCVYNYYFADLPICLLIFPTLPSHITESDSRGDKEDVLFLSLSIVVVVFTVITVLVVLIVLCVFFQHYQRDKSKVTSVDHFHNEIKGLSGKSLTYMSKTVNSRTDRAQLNNYV